MVLFNILLLTNFLQLYFLLFFNSLSSKAQIPVTNYPTSISSLDVDTRDMDYYFVKEAISVTWSEAETICKNRYKSHLGVFSSSKEYSYAISNVGDSFFIGLTDIEKNGNYLWTDNVTLPQWPFLSSTPSGTSSSTLNCVKYNYNSASPSTKGIVITSCNNEKLNNFICNKPHTDMYYVFQSDVVVSRASAKNICFFNYGTGLATVKSANDHIALNYLSQGKSYFIGLFKSASDSLFKWDSSLSVPSPPITNYRAWYYDGAETSSTSIPATCVKVLSNGRWIGVPCSDTVNFVICDKPVTREYYVDAYVSPLNTWEYSESQCYYKYGTNLGTITSSDDFNNFLLIKAPGVSSLGSSDISFGLNDIENEGEHRWTSNIELDDNYFDSLYNLQNTDTNDCYRIGRFPDRVYSVLCSSSLGGYYMCDKKPVREYYVEKMDYFFRKSQGEELCLSKYGTHLATVKRPEEIKMLNSIIGENPYWTGLTLNAIKNFWLSGEEFGTNDCSLTYDSSNSASIHVYINSLGIFSKSDDGAYCQYLVCDKPKPREYIFASSASAVTWKDAEQICLTTYGSHLATVKTSEDLSSLLYKTTTGSNSFYIGLNNAFGNIEEYLWASGDDVTLFNNWKTSPNYLSNTCVISKKDVGFSDINKWELVSCTNQETRYYYCDEPEAKQYYKHVRTLTLAIRGPSASPSYPPHTPLEIRTWDQGQNYCYSKYGTNLGTVSNINEVHNLKKWLKKKSDAIVSPSDVYFRGIMIGLRNKYTSTTQNYPYMWKSGYHYSDYFPWSSGQPISGSELCGFLNFLDGSFLDKDFFSVGSCSAVWSYAFICDRPKPKKFNLYSKEYINTNFNNANTICLNTFDSSLATVDNLVDHLHSRKLAIEKSYFIGLHNYAGVGNVYHHYGWMSFAKKTFFNIFELTTEPVGSTANERGTFVNPMGIWFTIQKTTSNNFLILCDPKPTPYIISPNVPSSGTLTLGASYCSGLGTSLAKIRNDDDFQSILRKTLGEQSFIGLQVNQITSIGYSFASGYTGQIYYGQWSNNFYVPGRGTLIHIDTGTSGNSTTYNYLTAAIPTSDGSRPNMKYICDPVNELMKITRSPSIRNPTVLTPTKAPFTNIPTIRTNINSPTTNSPRFSPSIQTSYPTINNIIKKTEDGIINSYYFVDYPLGKLTWNEAEFYCMSVYKTHLATITSIEELNYINSIALDDYYIGYNDKLFEEKFIWSSRVYSIFNNFDSGELLETTLTDNFPDERDCVYAKYTSNFKWFRISCKTMQTRYFFCDKPKTSSKYILVRTPINNITWDDAQIECQTRYNTNLATIKTASDHLTLNYMAQDFSYYIGLNDKINEGIFKWISDETSIKYTYKAFYGGGEPSIRTPTKNCVMAAWNSFGEWRDVECNVAKTRLFFCDKPIKHLEYYKVTPQSGSITWNSADNECLKLYGTHLATILTIEDINYLRSRKIGGTFFVGLNDKESKGLFSWASGIEETPYIVWSSSGIQPVSSTSMCVYIANSERFNVINCDSAIISGDFFCDKPPTREYYLEVISPSLTLDVLLNSPISTTWDYANNYCKRKYGTQLATIEREEDIWLLDTWSMSNNIFIGLNEKIGGKGYLEWESGHKHIMNNLKYSPLTSSFSLDLCWVLFKSNKNDMLSSFLFKDTRCNSWDRETTHIACDKPKPKEYIKVTNPTPLSWYLAQEICQKKYGSNLATIETLEDFMYAITLSEINSLYIGLSDYEGIGRYKWSSTGETLIGQSYFWTKGSPNVANNNILCGRILNNKNVNSPIYGFFVDHCMGALSSSFLCDIPSSISMYPFINSISPLLKPRFIEDKKYYYIKGVTALTWENANNYCLTNYGTTLGTITSDIENDKIIRIMSNVLSISYTSFFIGLHVKSRNGYYNWESGERFNGFTRFSNNEPSKGSGRHCFYMLIPDGWKDVSCSSQLLSAFICDKPKIKNYFNITKTTDITSWNSAESECSTTYKSHIATVNTKIDFDYLKRISQLKTFNIGLKRSYENQNYISELNSFYWISGYSSILYKKWGIGYPTTTLGSINVDCAYSINTIIEEGWGETTCSSTILNNRLLICDPKLREYDIFINDIDLTWEEAEYKCIQRGSHLATITTESEFDYLIKNTNYKSFFIGLNNKIDRSIFRWSSGIETTSYIKWETFPYLTLLFSIPILTTPTDMYCVRIINGLYRLDNCLTHGDHRISTYVCDKSILLLETTPSPITNQPTKIITSSPTQTISPTTNTITYSPTSNKKTDFFIKGSSDYIKETVLTGISWDDAESTCMSKYGTHLASITTEDDFNYIISLIPSILTNKAFYIGLQDKKIEGLFSWVSGMPYYYNKFEKVPSVKNSNLINCVVVMQFGISPNINWIWDHTSCSSIIIPSLSNSIPPALSHVLMFFCDKPKISKYYIEKSLIPINWKDANNECNKKYGTQLGTITSIEDSNMANILSSGIKTFIGFNDIKHEGTFKWVSNFTTTTTTTLFTNWNIGETSISAIDKDCTIIDNNEKWKSISCTSIQEASYYICDKIEYEKYYIVKHPTLLSWNDANNNCLLKYNTQLATIHNYHDEMSLNFLISGGNYTSEYINKNRYYIGANDITTNKIYTWKSGEKLIYSNFEKISPDIYIEPDDIDGSLNLFGCIMIKISKGWNDISCSDLLTNIYVCDKPKYTNEYILNDLRSLSTTLHLNWFKSQMSCINNYGTNLATIDSINDHNFIHKIIGTTISNEVWIGLNDIERNNKLIWESGSIYRYSSAWDSSTLFIPTPSPQSFSHSCVKYKGLATKTWIFGNCELDYLSMYLCDKPKTMDYHFITWDKKISWLKAEEICQSIYGTNLGIVSSIEEENTINSWSNGDNIYFGLNRNNNDNIIKWSSGKKFYDGYKKWGINEPSSSLLLKCSMISTNFTTISPLLYTENQLWYMISCTNDITNKFICNKLPPKIYLKGSLSTTGSSNKVNWIEAQNMCQYKTGMGLATIENLEDDYTIQIQSNIINTEYYIGLNNLNTKNNTKYGWINQNNKPLQLFSKWVKNRNDNTIIGKLTDTFPDDPNGNSIGEHCVFSIKISNFLYGWSDILCNTRYTSIFFCDTMSLLSPYINNNNVYRKINEKIYYEKGSGKNSLEYSSLCKQSYSNGLISILNIEELGFISQLEEYGYEKNSHNFQSSIGFNDINKYLYNMYESNIYTPYDIYVEQNPSNILDRCSIFYFGNFYRVRCGNNVGSNYFCDKEPIMTNNINKLSKLNNNNNFGDIDYYNNDEYLKYEQHYIKVVKLNSETWEQAELYCLTTYNTHLATIRSLNDLKILYHIIKTTTITETSRTVINNKYYIGLKYIYIGDELTTQSLNTLFKWVSKEKNEILFNFFSGVITILSIPSPLEGNLCVYVDVIDNIGVWKVSNCNTETITNVYFCDKPDINNNNYIKIKREPSTSSDATTKGYDKYIKIKQTTGNLSWLDAENICIQRYNSHLATVNSEKDSLILRDITLATELFYIGLIKKVSGASNNNLFEWISGETRSSYSNWHINEPAGTSLSLDNCVIVKDLSGILKKWDDIQCTTLSASMFFCDNPSYIYSDDDHPLTNGITWLEAENDCISKGSHLATIYSEKNLAYLNEQSNGSPYFIGLNKIDNFPNHLKNENQFNWISYNSYGISYQKWGFSNPNNNGIINDEKCVAVYSDGYMYDTSCTKTKLHLYYCDPTTNGENLFLSSIIKTFMPTTKNPTSITSSPTTSTPTTKKPTYKPTTDMPTTYIPSKNPTLPPTTNKPTTINPTKNPTLPTISPTINPTSSPTVFGHIRHMYKIPAGSIIVVEKNYMNISYSYESLTPVNITMSLQRGNMIAIVWKNLKYRVYDVYLNITLTKTIDMCNPGEISTIPGDLEIQHDGINKCPCINKCIGNENDLLECNDNTINLTPSPITGFPDLRCCICSKSLNDEPYPLESPINNKDISLTLKRIITPDEISSKLMNVEIYNAKIDILTETTTTSETTTTTSETNENIISDTRPKDNLGTLQCNQFVEREFNCQLYRQNIYYNFACANQPIGCYDKSLGAIFGGFYNQNPNYIYTPDFNKWTEGHYIGIASFINYKKYLDKNKEPIDPLHSLILNEYYFISFNSSSLIIKTETISLTIDLRVESYQTNLIQGYPYMNLGNSGNLKNDHGNNNLNDDINNFPLDYSLNSEFNVEENICYNELLLYNYDSTCKNILYNKDKKPRYKRPGLIYGFDIPLGRNVLSISIYISLFNSTYGRPDIKGIEVYNSWGESCGGIYNNDGFTKDFILNKDYGNPFVFVCEQSGISSKLRQNNDKNTYTIRIIGMNSMYDVPGMSIDYNHLTTNQNYKLDPLNNIWDILSSMSQYIGKGWPLFLSYFYDKKSIPQHEEYGINYKLWPQRQKLNIEYLTNPPFLQIKYNYTNILDTELELGRVQTIGEKISNISSNIFLYNIYPKNYPLEKRETNKNLPFTRFEYTELINLTKLEDKKYLQDIWKNHLAPRFCGADEIQCRTSQLGRCIIANTTSSRRWLNGGDYLYYENEGDEGGCDCWHSFDKGFYDKIVFCKTCINGYGPRSIKELNDMVFYNNSISSIIVKNIPFNGNNINNNNNNGGSGYLFNSLFNQTLLSLDADTFEKEYACKYPFGYDPVIGSYSEYNLCSGHGYLYEEIYNDKNNINITLDIYKIKDENIQEYIITCDKLIPWGSKDDKNSYKLLETNYLSPNSLIYMNDYGEYINILGSGDRIYGIYKNTHTLCYFVEPCNMGVLYNDNENKENEENDYIRKKYGSYDDLKINKEPKYPRPWTCELVCNLEPNENELYKSSNNIKLINEKNDLIYSEVLTCYNDKIFNKYADGLEKKIRYSRNIFLSLIF